MSTPNPIAAMIARSMPWLWASVAPTREPPVAKVPELGKDAVPPPADPCETPEIPMLQAIEPAARPPDRRQGAAPAGAEPIGKPGTMWPAVRVAEAFLGWVREHGLAGELTVDEVWFYASEDLCPARGLVLPKRQTFLAELRRLAGVKVMHDRRVRAKDGTVKGKTTVYMLPANDAVAELEPIRLAA